MSKSDDYKPGNPEYDYWNDKNLYPSLRHDEDFQLAQSTELDDSKVGFGTVFLAIFVWLLFLAPAAVFTTWENWLFQVVFWGGGAVILILFIVCLYNAYQEEQKKE